jgi:hypothetical protein
MGFSEDVLDQIAALQREFEALQERAEHEDLSGQGVPRTEVLSFRVRVRAALERLAPPGSTYAAEADWVTGRAEERGAWAGSVVQRYMTVLAALEEDVRAGYVRRLEERVREAVYDDFLDMASDICEIHAAPAAVVAGSVLEEHVRKLASANGINPLGPDGKPRKFEQITHDLVKKPVFSEPQRKVLAAWYGQRTEAAHGRYDNVIEEDVPRMIEGIRDFMVRFPA